MTSDSNKPSVAFWATVVVALALVIYPLSIGPAYLVALRIKSRPGPDWKWPIKVVDIAYAPVVQVAQVTNSVESLTAYVRWWTR